MTTHPLARISLPAALITALACSDGIPGQTPVQLLTARGTDQDEALGTAVAFNRFTRNFNVAWVIGAPGWNGGSGKVLVQFPNDPAPTVVGVGGPNQRLGESVLWLVESNVGAVWTLGSANGNDICDLGDIDGDGYSDFLSVTSGSPGDIRSGFGLNFAVGTLDAVRIGAGFPAAFANTGTCGHVGDVNGDRLPEFLIGEWDNGGSGRIWLIDGLTGNLLFTDAGAAGDRLGAAVVGVGDFDGDGTPDVAVGAPGDPTTSTGYVKVYSGLATGPNPSAIQVIQGPGLAEFGYDIAPAGDVDGDGLDDFLVAGPGDRSTSPGPSPGPSPGHVWLVKGSTAVQTLNTTLPGGSYPPLVSGSQVGSRFGHSIAGGVDFGPDGGTEFAVGTPRWDEPGNTTTREGRADFFTFPSQTGRQAWSKWGTACLTSLNTVPRASLEAPPRLGRSNEVRLTGAVPGSAVTLFLALDFQAFLLQSFGMPGCESYIGPSLFAIQPFTADVTGRAVSQFTVPVLPGLLGQQFVAQWLIGDPSANGFGGVTSDAVRGFLGN